MLKRVIAAASYIQTARSGLNMVLLIQVPLKQKHPMEQETVVYESAAPSAPLAVAESDVEAAVIGHGAVEGPFTEIDGLEIERDERFPIRVTVQFYKATSNGVVSAGDMEEIATQIKRVYDEADYVGSLVVDGPSERPHRVRRLQGRASGLVGRLLEAL